MRPDVIVLGIGIFAGYSQSGLAGRFGIISQAYLSDDAAVPLRRGVSLYGLIGQAIKGCLFGVSMWAISRCAVGPPSNDMLDRFAALGTFNRDYFSMIAWSFIASSAIVWFSAGTLIYLLGKPGLTVTDRIGVLCLPVAGALVLAGVKRPFTANAMSARYDTSDVVLATARAFDQKRPNASVPAGRVAAIELARRIPVRVADDKPIPFYDLVAFDSRGVFEVEVDKVTDDGLITEHEKCADVQAFLVKRKFQSALSWSAVKYIFNDANLNLDQNAEIRSGLDDLEYGPHMLNLGSAMRAIFFICSASPQNLALLNEYADESNFAHPTRESLRMMGDLYIRFGEVATAQHWYRKADMPRSFMQQVQSEKPLFHTGTVTGKLTWNGTPLARWCTCSRCASTVERTAR